MTIQKTKIMKRLVFITISLLFAILTASFQAKEPVAEKQQSNNQALVVTAHPLASQAAMDILHKGGNAIDAAVAAAFAIGVVEPGSSGIGGGGGMLIYLKDKNKLIYINYYQRASENILKINYDPKVDNKSAKAILVPGTVEGLITALEKYGTLPLNVILEPAIKFAEIGFEIDEFLGKSILDNVNLLRKYPSTEKIYFKEGFPLILGDTIKQLDLAETLKQIANLGREGFYDGKIARSIVDTVTKYGGVISLKDLKNYRAIITEPVKGSYRGYEVFSAAAPQSGAFVIEALHILENEELYNLGHYTESAECLHIMAETFKRVYADRTAYLDDPYFNPVPINGLTSKAYAKTRFKDINYNIATPIKYRDTKEGNPYAYEKLTTEKSVQETDSDSKFIWSDEDDEGKPTYIKVDEDIFDNWGKPKKSKEIKAKKREIRDTTLLEPIDIEQDGHTTHISVIDKNGNAVSLTQTLGTFFGSGLVVSGILFNNSMSNFGAKTITNAPKPNKQPRSSISPTILMKDGSPFIVVGSPGASRIIATIVQVIVNVIDFKMSATEANYAPRFFCQKLDDYLSLESSINISVQEALKEKGHKLKIYEGYDAYFGGVQLIVIDPRTKIITGSSDPRRGGVAIGD